MQKSEYWSEFNTLVQILHDYFDNGSRGEDQNFEQYNLLALTYCCDITIRRFPEHTACFRGMRNDLLEMYKESREDG